MLAQVHTHPHGRTTHSWGDDEMVQPAYEGMLSVVVSDYALSGLRPLETLGIHQLQDGEWVLTTPESVRASFGVIPAGVDIR